MHWYLQSSWHLQPNRRRGREREQSSATQRDTQERKSCERSPTLQDARGNSKSRATSRATAIAAQVGGGGMWHEKILVHSPVYFNCFRYIPHISCLSRVARTSPECPPPGVHTGALQLDTLWESCSNWSATASLSQPASRDGL